MDHKEPGLCTDCDEPIFEIIARYPDDSPLAGRVRQVGEPMPEAVRVTVILSGGSQMDLSFCEGCCDIKPEDFPKIWRKIMTSWSAEQNEAFRIALGCKPLTPNQLEWTAQWFNSIVDQIPIGVIHKVYWTDLEVVHGRS